MSAWETQELPVLRALDVHFAKEGAGAAQLDQIVADSGLGEDTVLEVLHVLAAARPPYVEGYGLGATLRELEEPRVTALTDRARRELERDDLASRLNRNETVGAWRPDSMPEGQH
jgi:hypothetical protein